MSKAERYYIFFTTEEKKYLRSQAQKKGFSTISKYIRAKLIPMQEFRTESNSLFKRERFENRSFRIKESMWNELKEKVKSPSAFIREAVEEKLQKLQNTSH